MDDDPRTKRDCDMCAKNQICFEVWRDGDYLRIQWLCVECIKRLRVAALKR